MITMVVRLGVICAASILLDIVWRAACGEVLDVPSK